MILPLLFLSSSINNQLPPGLLEAVCWIESKHDPRIVTLHDGGSPSFGICQIKYSTAKMMGFTGTVAELMKPQVNIEYAAKYLRYNLSRYNYNLPRAITAYNKGRSTSHGKSRYYYKVLSEFNRRNFSQYSGCFASRQLQ